jgi:hypothetical protein
MRGIVALVVVAMSFTLSGCACPPHQAGSPKPVRSKCALAQSQPRVPKFTKPSVTKKASRPISKQSKKFKTHLSKPSRHQIEPRASADTGPPRPPRRPEPAHIESPATDAESPPPLPPRKPEEASTGAPDSREHAIKPDGKFTAAKEKAMREGVHTLTGEDVRGLSQEQITELRGY